MRIVLLTWLLMHLLEPAHDHARLATEVASVALERGPLFKGDVELDRTVAFMSAVAFREGTLRERVTGDHGQSFCTFQVHASMGGTEALNENLHACVERAYEILRLSFRACPAEPLAWYTVGGSDACSSPRGQRLSRDRLALAKRTLKQVEYIGAQRLSESQEP